VNFDLILAQFKFLFYGVWFSESWSRSPEHG
jgi:hypothetical protein